MFKCQFCQKQSLKGEPCRLITTKLHEVRQPFPLPPTMEIEEQKRACPRCAERIDANEAAAAAEVARERLLAKFGEAPKPKR